jgi:hypothetical protein
MPLAPQRIGRQKTIANCHLSPLNWIIQGNEPYVGEKSRDNGCHGRPSLYKQEITIDAAPEAIT